MAGQPNWPNGTNLAYVEHLYELYLNDPHAVDEGWRKQFEQWQGGPRLQVNERLGPRFKARSLFNPVPTNGNGNGHAVIANGNGAMPPGSVPVPSGHVSISDMSSLQHRLDQLIRNYRVRGHIVANIDPLGIVNESPTELEPRYYGFTPEDMNCPVFTTNVPGETLSEVISNLEETYCRNIGVQFMHIDNLQVREWLQRKMESTRNRTKLTRKEQIRILTRLTDAVIFEEFIQRKFIGAKSFSLEGAESVIPLLDLALETAGDQGVREIVIGMAHRGRLNVLANIMGKSPQKIFREFEDVDPRRYWGGGDVKYHLGYSSDWRTRHGHNLHLSLCFNPSHLEYVNTVAMGRMRAKQDKSGLGTRGEKGMVMLIHGDAAFAGEGIIQETLNLSNLPGYTVGGTLHIVVNNQIGFTTGAKQARSCRYATDVAKMLQIPIFHVNGEEPEAVAQVVRLAMEFRMEFKRDVVIDMYCYRKRGHNESDEPSYTQPYMYSKIAKRKPVRENYLDHLLKLGGVTRGDADRIALRRTELLEKDLTAARSDHFVHDKMWVLEGKWSGYYGGSEHDADEVMTGIEKETLCKYLTRMTQTPDTFKLHPKLKRFMNNRLEMAEGKRPLDWSAGESLAYAALAVAGHRIRISGQDAQRGTFSHRHAVLSDYSDGHEYNVLQHVAEEQATVEVYNSPLSESGVLGFDYGYSLETPNSLVIWEAQFGDFANVAQVIIDQFIASAEDKWRRLSGLVMLLPHGFEGQGPEHSSARLERFLALAAQDNFQVVQPSTPAQVFHLLRRQMVRRWRKPLVVMTPKSLLRNPKCVSDLDDLTTGTFKRVIRDEKADTKKVTRVLLCSGRVYYDLIERREQLGRDDIAIARIEQFYPFPDDELRMLLMRHSDDVPVIWVQDEPENMGAWPFLRMKFGDRIYDRQRFLASTRAASASPATGSRAAHLLEQDELISEAFCKGLH
ncbi:2-oxoglutarate dehydrogenase E1 component [Poriferisphaera corsica]|uniref:2-oxoglutarate dehydrogenase E1 component n=1 Tax=Poriferisphaera corsica TaxID=2528020 RepID=A0A517YXG3_9BACT|nr:2-oxoglutarate dehydrogenase E1 component [Poriferisphaera corsica]QDU34917.1 2-oxoglutarate dehydrogenase E1 component [Poriferisphaera corsica]